MVIASYQHSHDESCLGRVLGKQARFVGLMGSRRKAAVIRRNLVDQGFDAAELERVQVPVGLAIGAETPEEIALSIVAELVRVRRLSSARSHVAGLIAAAGDSFRMGQAKAFLELDGEPLLRRLVRIYNAAGINPCIVTVPPGEPGQKTALGLVGEEPTALVVNPVDAPFIDETGLRRLIEAVDVDRIVVPEHEGRAGHPVLFGRRFFKKLKSAEADQGAHLVVAQAGDKRLGLTWEDARLCEDLNSPEDAARLGVSFPQGA